MRKQNLNVNLYIKKSVRPKVIFPITKETLMNNHPLNKWNKYTKIRVKNNLYITKPQPPIMTNMEG